MSLLGAVVCENIKGFTALFSLDIWQTYCNLGLGLCP